MVALINHLLTYLQLHITLRR